MVRSLDNGSIPHTRPTRSGSVDHAVVDAYLDEANRNETVQHALRLAAECDERWYNRSNWSRCELAPATAFA